MTIVETVCCLQIKRISNGGAKNRSAKRHLLRKSSLNEQSLSTEWNDFLQYNLSQATSLANITFLILRLLWLSIDRLQLLEPHLEALGRVFGSVMER